MARHHPGAGRLWALPVIAALVAAACGGPSTSGTPHPSAAAGPPSANAPGATAEPRTPAASRGALEAAQADLDRLLEELERTHPAPFHGIDREAWVAELQELRDGLGDMTPEEALVGLQRVTALLSRNGRDGHQLALPVAGSPGPVLPIRLYEFDDGVFITAAIDPGQADLVGARLEAVNGHAIADVLAALEPLVPRDGPSTVPLFRPVYFSRTEVLRGLGLIEAGDFPITVTPAGGRPKRDVTIHPIPFAEYSAWAGDLGVIRVAERPGLGYASDLDTIFSWRRIDGGRTAYLRYTQMRPIPAGNLRDILAAAKSGDIDRVVLDLRQNPGGDNHNVPPLLNLLKDPAIDRDGHLFVLTDHVTFSAASNLSTQIEQETTASFVGEAMGGGLNFWDDVRFVRLSSYPIPAQVGVSTRYWQFAPADDPRLTIEPDIPVPALASDYFGDRDPVLEAAIARD